MNKSEASQNSLAFIHDVAAYFMDFLETDFHKRKLPKRSVKTRNNDNLLVGLSLQKYPSFHRKIVELIKDGFREENKIGISRGVYKTNLPKNLVELIKLQVGKISSAQINKTLDSIQSEIENLGTLHAEEHDVALTRSLESAEALLRETLVTPFITQIEKPLQNLELGTDEDLFSLEEELSAILLRQIEGKIAECLNLLMAKSKVNIGKELKSVFPLDEVRVSILEFFENLQVADIYAELFEMERNKGILDKQEFYLYFGDIAYGNIRYPIFYLPFTLSRREETFDVTFDSQIYINKKALEFIVQEINAQKGKKGTLESVTERIIYLGNPELNVFEMLQGIITEIGSFFELNAAINLSAKEHVVGKSQLVRVSNASYINLFDKSDEALVNDYEDILQQLDTEDSPLAEMFKVLIDDFINKNPIPCNPEVEDEWDAMPTSERLVPLSPIPLNSEQLQILSALAKDNCKYVVVQGPPGTGKSHTITAIIFDAILKNHSVLVLSDKKEALDVVEDKITSTMNKVRFDKNFQNPILRLGNTGSTYGAILAKATVENINAHFRATKKNFDEVEQNIDKLKNSLREDLEAEILAYGDIDINEIHELYDLEAGVQKYGALFDFDELLNCDDAAADLDTLKSSVLVIRDALNSVHTKTIFNACGLSADAVLTLAEIRESLIDIAQVSSVVERIKTETPNILEALSCFKTLSSGDAEKLGHYAEEYKALNKWLIGYTFNKKAVEKLDGQFTRDFPLSSFDSPHSSIDALVTSMNAILHLKAALEPISSGSKDLVTLAHKAMVQNDFSEGLRASASLLEAIDEIIEALNVFPETMLKLSIDLGKISEFHNNKLFEISDLSFNQIVRFIGLKQKLNSEFSKIPELNYDEKKKSLEDLVTARATHLLDGRLINFCQNNKNDAEGLRNIIRTKQRFPKEQFAKLKEAFPCILAGIRDYAEYIPLEPGMFDLVIIDEASQVSIAQAFPALLRAKKVLILGDKKQFSNIKAAQARSDTNREYLNRISDSFRKNVSTDIAKTIKLEKFNIKTSILEFFQSICNYDIQLLKHFRGYKEIISYSNKYFYQNNLQVMKIRGKAIDNVIKFTVLETKENTAPYPNTNTVEAEFVITELQRIRESGSNDSIGIITPHTNQQKLLTEMIYKLPEKDDYFEKMNLKIMTFDTCQGEERDVIYYSMVANKESDRLWGVFIKDLNNVDLEEEGQIKAQRLNVGLSRAKETMHFVLSKDIADFSGSIGEALSHYNFALQEAKKERDVAETDHNSKMESEVLNWFYQTKFWQEHRDSIEFIPQFEIGKYLKQLDHTYSHPNYKVDFLLTYCDSSHREHKIIIEYDGFQEHFTDTELVNEFNYQDYYSSDDLYRQKVLESYGYKFLRINKFNIGKNPIETLDSRIAVFLKVSRSQNPLLLNIRETVSGLQNGEMKECPKCKEVRNQSDFKDASLITGYGRFCKMCKGARNESRVIDSGNAPNAAATDQTCPRCAAKMILRNGKRGKFYGCSKFPYCKGTRNY